MGLHTDRQLIRTGNIGYIKRYGRQLTRVTISGPPQPVTLTRYPRRWYGGPAGGHRWTHSLNGRARSSPSEGSTMPESPEHKRTVREAFTKQADAYAANSSLTDPEKVDRLVEATATGPGDCMLEVATGPGHVAFGFVEVCEEVVGIDLTEAPLEIAWEEQGDRDVDDVGFARGDAEQLPFPDDSFDVVVCRLALHHIETPTQVVQQMARVCRPNGTVAVDDLVVSEHPERGEYQNRFERLRDPSHVRALPISELLGIFTENGLEVTNVETGVLVPEVEEWLSNAQTPEPRATEARKLIRRDAERDLSGTRPFWRDDELYFVQRTAIVVGRSLGEDAANETVRSRSTS